MAILTRLTMERSLFLGARPTRVPASRGDLRRRLWSEPRRVCQIGGGVRESSSLEEHYEHGRLPLGPRTVRTDVRAQGIVGGALALCLRLNRPSSCLKATVNRCGNGLRGWFDSADWGTLSTKKKTAMTMLIVESFTKNAKLKERERDANIRICQRIITGTQTSAAGVTAPAIPKRELEKKKKPKKWRRTIVP